MSACLSKKVGAVVFSAALLGSVSAVVGAPETETTVAKVPGAIAISDSVKMSATIKAIDAETRNITLENDEGTFVIKAGPAVINFDKLAVGDKVSATYTEAVALSLGKDGAPGADAGAAVIRPEAGVPGGAAVAAVQITAQVKELDVKKRRATLELPDKTVRKIKVREEVDLSKVAVGDTVSITLVESLVIDVEKP